ncbi:hypothetical protein ES319_A11G103300v1 [Gossypium barbadense]|uniref:Polymerase nucleotidyl transferase domain-containing protein n=2 Tax=Gossypium TaxID=3633 RepID=A0A5J5TL20_GOSBA|nr:hypothetical protein ES319_A11G103300v1 [Gossypium barbadense]TYG93439.1 hypothetical protein ES288_A11G110500v1 [Gossypium darwinii]
MGEHEGWAALQPPNGLLPNGLLPNEAASVIQMLDPERWMKAEERTADLIACIQPDAPSAGRRNDVADYVQRLITKCFPCQVFTFGSVPLKTYLPDGDIDLMAFSKNQNLKDMWAHQVRDMLENEEKNENAEFRVKEVQYIQAEVKIIKCLVENIVVDISFNQLGGLCSLCFLEEVDILINQNQLFKRSIILIKAWCYYESRILGAHHGLISTYALETLVLYIFHVFNKSFSGPLEVLYRFLEFFSKFDWENFCVSLWGPVPISSLPEITAELPRKDGGELLLSKYFLHTCSSRYAVCQENQGQPFVSKHFNVIDPLRINNNLGRSVSKGNFFRIRSAFAFGVKKLARLLDCPKEDLFHEVNQFFMNTWERHGSSQRPDAPRNDLWCLRLSKADQTQESKNVRNNSISKVNDISSRLQTQGSCSVSSQHVIHPSESTTKVNEISTVSCAQSQKGYGSICNSKTSDQVRWVSNSNQNVHSSTGQNISKAETLVTDAQERYLFARTRSSPELTETCQEFTSQGRQNGVPESGKTQIASVRTDKDRRKNMDSDMVASYNIKSSGDTSSSVRCTSTRQSIDTAAEPNSFLNGCQDDSGLGSTGQDFSSILGAQGMHQEKQDLVNMMPSSAVHGFNGQVPFPLNLAAGDLPFPIHSLSMGYDQRILGRLVPTNIEMFPQGLISCPFANYFSGIELPSNSEDPPGEVEHELRHEQDRGPSGGFDLDNGSFEILQSDDKQLSTSPRVGSSDNSTKVQHKFSEDIQGSSREDHIDVCQYQDNRGGNVYFEERIVSSRHLAVSHASSYRSKTSSESYWEGSSAKIPKPSKEKRGRKTAASVLPSAAGRKGKIVSEHSSQADDGRDWNSPSIPGTEMAERTTGPQLVGSLPVTKHQMSGSEAAQTNGSDPLIPVTPFPLGLGSGKRTTDNSGLSTLAFTITGPPLPFLFCPFHNIPADIGTPDASKSHVSWDEGSDNTDSGLNFESSERLDQSEVLSTSSSMRKVMSLEPAEHKSMLSTSSSMRKVMSLEPAEHKSDILNGDIASHWQNLQDGWFCQSSRFSPPMIYPSPVVVPPLYLQGHFTLDGPGRPLPSNLSLSQLMNYGPRIFPVASFQSVSSRPANLYQWYFDEMPRYRSGTRTYLPNPKASVRERHSANSRRGKHNYDRNGQQGDREGNWNGNSKYRAAGRSQSRNQNEKSKFSFDQLAAVGGESRTERPCCSRRHDSFTSYQSHNGSVHSKLFTK